MMFFEGLLEHDSFGQEARREAPGGATGAPLRLVHDGVAEALLLSFLLHTLLLCASLTSYLIWDPWSLAAAEDSFFPKCSQAAPFVANGGHTSCDPRRRFR